MTFSPFCMMLRRTTGNANDVTSEKNNCWSRHQEVVETRGLMFRASKQPVDWQENTVYRHGTGAQHRPCLSFPARGTENPPLLIWRPNEHNILWCHPSVSSFPDDDDFWRGSMRPAIVISGASSLRPDQGLQISRVMSRQSESSLWWMLNRGVSLH